MGAAVAYISKGAAPREVARLRLVECRAILGGEYDPMRDIWDCQATVKDRRLLLAMAGRVATDAGRLAGRAWCDLPNDLRVAIAGGLRRWSAWAERLR